MTVRTATPLSPDVEAIRDILRRVVDPELGVNIVDLGLIYRIEPGADRLLIEMTMTSPACPMGGMIVDDVRSALAGILPAACELDVQLVWEPPWEPSMMAEGARAHFGW